MNELRILAPTGILGYGFPAESLRAGMERAPHVIGVDGGSSDGGPYYLGIEPELAQGRSGAFRDFLRRDLEPLLRASAEASVPLIIGSAGFAGADLHLFGTVGLAQMIARECGLRRRRMATIRAQIEPAIVSKALAAGRITALASAPALNQAEIDRAVRIVGQMGVEPFVEALDNDAEVIIAGRANDPSIFAAMPWRLGFDKGLSLHMAKILECGAIACDPGSGSDALLGTLREDHFDIEAMNPDRRATVRSVAAHSMYEKSDPFHLYGPGGHVDLKGVSFEQLDDRRVRVRGSRWVPDATYRVKLEGARRVGFRTIAVAGLRDPSAIAALDELLAETLRQTAAKFPDVDVDRAVSIKVYGRDGVMGPQEPTPHAGHEVGLVLEAVAAEQGLATSLCGHARSVLFHLGFPGRTSTAGNLAMPFSPQDIPAGPVYAFNIYHLMETDDPAALFPIDYMDIGS
jgi:hypothetical protein